MQCLVLAGGLGTRMRSISSTLPKALLPMGPQTFIDWQLQWLKILGINHVVMALGHGGEEIRDHLETKQTSSTYPQVNYSFDGPSLLGTGGAIKNALYLLSPDFVVTYGDTILALDFKKMTESHLKSKKDFTLAILRNRDHGDKSNVEFADGKIIDYSKTKITPRMEFIDYGISIVNKSYFKKFATNEKFDYADFMTEAIRTHNTNPFVVEKMFQEIGSPEGYKTFEVELKRVDYDLKRLAKNLL